jgi:hypothetical protein
MEPLQEVSREQKQSSCLYLETEFIQRMNKFSSSCMRTSQRTNTSRTIPSEIHGKKQKNTGQPCDTQAEPTRQKWALKLFAFQCVAYSEPDYYTIDIHCRYHHCWFSVNLLWRLFSVGSGLRNQKMIEGGKEPAVKVNITAGLLLEPAVSGRWHITAGSSQEPTVMWWYHYRFVALADSDKLSTKRLSSSPPSSLPSWAHPFRRPTFSPLSPLLRPFFALKLLDFEAWAWSSCFKVSNKHPLLWICCYTVVLMAKFCLILILFVSLF